MLDRFPFRSASRPFRALQVAIIATCAIAPGPVLAQEKKLQGSEIKRVFSGKSATWVAQAGQYKGETSWRSNGTLIGKVDLGGNSTQNFQGTWEIRGNRFCQTVAIDPQGTRCQDIVRVSRNTYHILTPTGGVGSVLTIRN